MTEICHNCWNATEKLVSIAHTDGMFQRSSPETSFTAEAADVIIATLCFVFIPMQGSSDKDLPHCDSEMFKLYKEVICLDISRTLHSLDITLLLVDSQRIMQTINQ